jgi:hypothetical protein
VECCVCPGPVLRVRVPVLLSVVDCRRSLPSVWLLRLPIAFVCRAVRLLWGRYRDWMLLVKSQTTHRSEQSSAAPC